MRSNDREKWIREYLKTNGLKNYEDSREAAIRAYNQVYKGASK